MELAVCFRRHADELLQYAKIYGMRGEVWEHPGVHLTWIGGHALRVMRSSPVLGSTFRGVLSKDLLSESITYSCPPECSLERPLRVGIHASLEKGLSNPFPQSFPKKFKNLL
ncbi:uncharacterized protein LOC144288111 [Canis aureus]